MSAIAAILRFHGEPVRDGEIESLIGAMQSRGPDGSTVWRESSIALAHGMLHGTPESLAEKQPLAAADNRYRMIWDGRLDNRDELRHELALHHVAPRDETDPELVLQIYLLHRERTPERLLGDFAFAIWDSIDEQLFCARDHVGARPFYYVLTNDLFALASEDDALLALPGVSNKPNEDRIAYALVPGFDCFDWQMSWLEDVRILMPATALTVTLARRMTRVSYATLRPEHELSFSSFDECKEAFLAVFGASVGARMRVGGHVAALVSGGMDSAGICAMVRRQLHAYPGKRFRTYSAISDDRELSLETRSILQLTGDLGDDANYVSVPSFTGMVNLDDLLDIAWSRPHPVDNSILLPAAMCLAASRRGDRVLLHGASGDVAMDSPLYYLRYVYEDEGLAAMWRECRLAAQNHTYLHGRSSASILLHNLYRWWLPVAARTFVSRVRQRLSTNATAGSPIKAEFAHRLNIERRMDFARLRARRAEACGPVDDHLQALQPIGVVRGLEGFERVAGRYGVELRDPWSDVRVLRFFAALPVRYKVRAGWTKALARDAFESDCSEGVVRRHDKEHLGGHFNAHAWSRVEDFDARNDAPDHPYSDYGRLSRYLGPAKGETVLHNAEPLFRVLEAWLQRISNVLPKAIAPGK